MINPNISEEGRQARSEKNDPRIDAVVGFIKNRNWLAEIDDARFLASGEYNENYLISSKNRYFVFRINHGSQLNLNNQIEYEFQVLQSVHESGVTPKPHYFSLDAEGLGQGVLLMDYIGGRKFEYARDSDLAARVFARIHQLPTSGYLITQRDPIKDIAHESAGLLKKYDKHPLRREASILWRYHEKIFEIADRNKNIFETENLCIVNTEVNSGNFIVRDTDAFLVDWEKAVNSYRYQDLGHFLVPTTTLWKSDFVFESNQKREFLKQYLEHFGSAGDLTELKEKTELLERTILLRALAWCYMAYFEYTMLDRALRDELTLAKIRSYLNEIERFLQM